MYPNDKLERVQWTARLNESENQQYVPPSIIDTENSYTSVTFIMSYRLSPFAVQLPFFASFVSTESFLCFRLRFYFSFCLCYFSCFLPSLWFFFSLFHLVPPTPRRPFTDYCLTCLSQRRPSLNSFFLLVYLLNIFFLVFSLKFFYIYFFFFSSFPF